MLPILSPLFIVFGIMLSGFVVQKARILPQETDNVLNQYVYYIAFPAIMLIVLAETPIEQITDWGFIAGYSLAMTIIYLLTMGISLWRDKKRDLAAIRALNTTFGNTSFIGIPLMMMLYPNNQLALAAAAIASLLSVTVFAIVLAQLALYQGQTDSALKTVALALLQNPIIIGSLIGVAISAAQISLYSPISGIIRQFGMTSSPCALFAIGMVLCKANQQQGRNAPRKLSTGAELTLLNLLKLVLQPLFAYLLCKAFGVEGPLLKMAVLLAALPTAASVYLLAHRFQTNATVSAQNISLGIVLSFAVLPLLDHLL